MLEVRCQLNHFFIAVKLIHNGFVAKKVFIKCLLDELT